MNSFVYMRIQIAEVPKVKAKVSVKGRKALILGGFWKLDTTPEGGEPAGPFSRV